MIVLIAALVLILKIKYSGNGKFYDDNFSVSQTRAFKGVFAIYVVFHHLCTYLADFFPSFYAFKYIGFLMVGGFFMISGYGLMYGVKNKQNYLKGFFRNRVMSILVPYYIINLFYLYANKISGILTKEYIIGSVFGFNLWYVMAITILYIAFYFSFKLFGNKNGVKVICLSTVSYITIMYILYKFFNCHSLGFWWYNSAICFAIGILYCNFKEKTDTFLKKHYIPLLLVSVIVIIPTYYHTSLHFNDGLISVLLAEILCSVAFSILVLLMSMKFKIANPVLNFCGDISLELYLSHALFIFALRSNISVFGITINITNNLLYLVLILAGSLFFSYVVHWISKFILKYIKK